MDITVVEPSTEVNFDTFRNGDIFLNDGFGNEIVINFDDDISIL